MNDARWAIVLAGGRGTRFWPLSRRHLPKQCLSLDGGPSLLERAIARAGVPEERVVVVTGPDMVDAVRARAGTARVLVEPSPRGTAPAIALALEVVAGAGGGSVVVLPADHVVRDEQAFRAALDGAGQAIDGGALLTFGVVPTRPETGFGWIVARVDAGPAAPVERFVEKPPRATAESLLASGALWNAGIFAGRVDVFRAAFARWLPRTHAALRDARHGEVDDATWLGTDAISVDHGIMEPAAAAGALRVARLACGWSDLGAWSALGDVLPAGEGGHVLARDVVALDARGNVVHAPDRVVALLGVEGLVVVDAGDVLLVTRAEHAQDVRRLVDALEARGHGQIT